MSSTPSTTSTLGALALVVSLVGGFTLLPRLFHRQATEAPEFSLELVANAAQLPGTPDKVRSTDLRGNAVLLDFWATWCGPCRAEAPIVERVSRRLKDAGLVVVGVNEDKPDEGDPGAFARKEGLTYPIARDANGQTMRAFEADSLPTLVVLSRAGKITAVRAGVTDDAELERLVRKALDSQAL